MYFAMADGMGDVRTRADRVTILNWQVKRIDVRFASTVLWYNFVLTSKHNYREEVVHRHQ